MALADARLMDGSTIVWFADGEPEVQPSPFEGEADFVSSRERGWWFTTYIDGAMHEGYGGETEQDAHDAALALHEAVGESRAADAES
jgi:hypothetical protein